MQRPANVWIEPISDARALPSDSDPSERAILKQSIRLAFVAALQKLAPKQRAALLLMDVLGFSAAEAAETLDTSVASVNSALQRARAALSDRNFHGSPDLTEPQMEMLNRYVAAFEQYDIDALTTLLRQDATLSMPPYALWFQGPEAIRNWMLGLGCGCRGSRLVPTAACGSPAFGQYRVNPEGGHKAWALIVLELSGRPDRRRQLVSRRGGPFPSFRSATFVAGQLNIFFRRSDEFPPSRQSLPAKENT